MIKSYSTSPRGPDVASSALPAIDDAGISLSACIGLQGMFVIGGADGIKPISSGIRNSSGIDVPLRIGL